jgi:predicted MPP superfamily phosphohydrolase
MLVDLYVFQAVINLSQSLSKMQRSILYAVYWVVPIIVVFTLYCVSKGYTDSWPKAVFTLVRAFLFIIYISKLIALIPLILDDIRRFFVWTKGQIVKDSVYDASRSGFMSKMALIISGLPFGILSYGILRNPYRYKLHTETILIKDLPDDLENFKIVQISDIHSGSFFLKEPVKSSVAMVNKCKPDIVFFTGDLVNSKTDEINEYFDIFDKIESKYGVYSVLGNHDYGDYHQWNSEDEKKKNFNDMIKAHKTLGWKLLLNENARIQIGESTLGIIGVENYSMTRRFPKYGDLKKAHLGIEPTDFKVLLSHDPSHWDGQVTNHYKDIRLTLSGHTHGFQFGVEIPGWLKWSPSQYVYKQWAGLYQENDQFLYVNRGLGFLGYPGRVGILPEITEIILKRG